MATTKSKREILYEECPKVKTLKLTPLQKVETRVPIGTFPFNKKAHRKNAPI
jgi:hypothetical protein